MKIKNIFNHFHNWKQNENKMKKNKTKQEGDKFEIFIEKLLKKLHKPFVKRDIHKKKKTRKNGNIYSQIDLVYGVLTKTYVECKYRSNSNVDLSEVTKFYGVLELSHKKGEIYTNQYFVPRAKEWAKHHKNKLTLYDRDDIIKLYYKSQPLIKKIFTKKKKDIDLEKIIWKKYL